MAGFVLRRLAFGLLVLAVLSFASFCFFAGQKGTLPAGRPVVDEFWTWFKGLGTGSSLEPLRTPQRSRLNPVGTTIADAAGHTAALLAISLVLVLLFSVLLALAATLRRGTALDVVLRGSTYLAWGIPAFLAALLVQKVANGVGGSDGLGPFPIAGWPGSCPTGLGVNAGTVHPCPAAGHGLEYVWNVFRYVTLPALTLALGVVALHGRYLRAALVELADAPFVSAARAKGLSEPRLLLRHALRVTAGPFLAGVLADFGAVFGAAMAIDFTFELNGLGTLFPNLFPLDSFSPIDTYAVQMVLLITGGLVIVASLLGELALVALDPRIRAAR